MRACRPTSWSDACKQQRVKAVFTVPSMHNPSVVTMSAERRAAIAAIARAA